MSESKDFLRTIVEEDNASGKYGGNVVTRFPPEPNGFPHIGHAKSICINFGIAKDYNGHCNLRMDDTNPTKEDTKYVEALKDAVLWLGFDWGDNMFFASDYFPKLYEYAVKLIKLGKAYVDSSTEEEIRENRGTVTTAGKESPYRNRSIEENLELFEKMKNGEFENGEHVLRAKIDMSASNMKMRDPLLYRIRHAHHFRTGDNWCIYPMYDFAHCLSDYIEGVTHSICTLEFENNRDIYDWILDELELEPPRPYQYEFARLNINYMQMSKRKLLELVMDNHVNGWDDPRLPTLAGFKRRGYTAQSILDFCDTIGISKADSTVDMSQLEFCIRNDLNKNVPRVMAVLDPIKVTIENYEGMEEIEASYYPQGLEKEGSRKISFSKEIYIERSDFRENPPKGYYRLTPKQPVRLKSAYIIEFVKAIKNSDGEIIEIKAKYYPESKSGNDTSGIKVKSAIQWVDANNNDIAEVRIYDRLFKVENPVDLTDLNENSLQVIENAVIEKAIKSQRADERFQFERQGYFYIDPIDSKDDKLVFNKIVSLKDSWKKESVKPIEAKKVENNLQIHGEMVLSDEARAKKAEFEKLGLNSEVSTILAKDKALGSFFEKTAKINDNAKSVANWVANDISKLLKDGQELKVTPENLSNLIHAVDNGEISNNTARVVFEDIVKTGNSVKNIIAEKGLSQINDENQIINFIEKVINSSPDNVEKYKSGNKRIAGFFVGQVMKLTEGKANPQLVNKLVNKKLEELI